MLVFLTHSLPFPLLNTNTTKGISCFYFAIFIHKTKQQHVLVLMEGKFRKFLSPHRCDVCVLAAAAFGSLDSVASYTEIASAGGNSWFGGFVIGLCWWSTHFLSFTHDPSASRQLTRRINPKCLCWCTHQFISFVEKSCFEEVLV